MELRKEEVLTEAQKRRIPSTLKKHCTRGHAGNTIKQVPYMGVLSLSFFLTFFSLQLVDVLMARSVGFVVRHNACSAWMFGFAEQKR